MIELKSSFITYGQISRNLFLLWVIYNYFFPFFNLLYFTSIESSLIEINSIISMHSVI